MNKVEINRAVSKYKKLLRSYPPGLKNKKRRKAYLKINSVGGKKIFFDLFLHKISTGNYNINDQYRRLQVVPLLPKIFKEKYPKKNTSDTIVFVEKSFEIVIKKVKDKKGNSLHLLSIYPQKN